MLFSDPHEVTVYYGESIFAYGVMSCMHFFGFLTAMYVFRIADSEQLQNLVERVFLLSNIPNKLFYILWLHMGCGVVWLITMTAYIVVIEQDQMPDAPEMIVFDAPTKESINLLQVLLVLTTCCQDLMQVVVLTSYSIQCYLLRRYLFILKRKLLHNTMDSLSWMRVSAADRLKGVAF